MAGDDGVEVYRPGSARPVAVATWATCAALLVGQSLAGPLDAIGTYAVLSGVLAAAGLAYVALWTPSVQVAPHGVELRNPLRRVLVTWPALVEVDGRYGLRLQTRSGRWSAWAASPPTGRARAGGVGSEAATVVRRAWDDVRGAGHLEAGVVEHPEASVTWRTTPALLLVGAPSLVCLVLALLA